MNYSKDKIVGKTIKWRSCNREKQGIVLAVIPANQRVSSCYPRIREIPLNRGVSHFRKFDGAASKNNRLLVKAAARFRAAWYYMPSVTSANVANDKWLPKEGTIVDTVRVIYNPNDIVGKNIEWWQTQNSRKQGEVLAIIPANTNILEACPWANELPPSLLRGNFVSPYERIMIRVVQEKSTKPLYYTPTVCPENQQKGLYLPNSGKIL